MMIVQKNSFSCPPEGGAQREEEAGSRKKGGLTGTSSPDADAPTDPIGQGCQIRETGGNMVV